MSTWIRFDEPLSIAPYERNTAINKRIELLPFFEIYIFGDFRFREGRWVVRPVNLHIQGFLPHQILEVMHSRTQKSGKARISKRCFFEQKTLFIEFSLGTRVVDGQYKKKFHLLAGVESGWLVVSKLFLDTTLPNHFWHLQVLSFSRPSPSSF